MYVCVRVYVRVLLLVISLLYDYRPTLLRFRVPCYVPIVFKQFSLSFTDKVQLHMYVVSIRIQTTVTVL